MQDQWERISIFKPILGSLTLIVGLGAALFQAIFAAQTTPGEPYLVKDISSKTGPSYPQYMVEVNGMLFFTAYDNIHGVELWMSDGTEDGTLMVKDIYSGASSSFPRSLTNVYGTLYFGADDGFMAMNYGRVTEQKPER
jgi:ELWxxDGT repeat protein